MRHKISAVLQLTILVALALGISSCQQSADNRQKSDSLIRPQPIEHWLDQDAEERNKEGRREYFEMMHRTAPGVDWRAIERENGLAAMERRRIALSNPRVTREAGTWQELGSRNQAGRMHCAAWSEDRQTIYSGSDRGGLWMTNRDGSQWTPLGDNLYGGVHEVGVVPGSGGDPDILIRLYGSMVHRSVDLGETWTVPAGMENVTATKRILVLDDDDSTVVALIFKSSTWHLMVSTDSGVSFVSRRQLARRGDIWTPRDTLGPLYLADLNRIYESQDAGQNWSTVGTPIPSEGTGEMILAGSENPAVRFNVALDNNGTWELWRSNPEGTFSWDHVHDLDDFWKSLVASNQDGDRIAYAGVEMFVSRNGGSSWQKVNDWGTYYGDPANMLHADVPGLYVFPDPDATSGEIWYVGTDGGLYHSEDRMDSVNNLSLSGLGVSQYYTVMTSRRNPDLVLAGSQDQGYQRADLGGIEPPPSGPWADFDQLISGDYGHLTSSNGAHDLVYSVYPGFVLVQEGEDSPSLLYPWVDFPAGESYLWMPYILADPLDDESFFFCATKLYRYTRTSGPNWNHAVHSEQDFGYGYLTAIAFSPLDANRAWAATSAGELYYSNDGAITWTLSDSTGPGSHYFYGTVLLPSSTDPDTCWVAGSGYSTAPVKRTTDGGVTWKDERNGLPDTLVYCMAESPDGSGVMFCGSENGAWKYDPGTGIWSDLLGAIAPITTYWTCESVPSQNLIRFGTYGRGIWDYHLNTPGYFPYGELLEAPNVLELNNGSAPRIGQATTFTIFGCKPAAKIKLVASTSPDEASLFGGTLLVGLPALRIFSSTADSSGTATVTFTWPNNPNLVGKEYYFQAAARDSGQVQGWALSNGLRAVVGN